MLHDLLRFTFHVSCFPLQRFNATITSSTKGVFITAKNLCGLSLPSAHVDLTAGMHAMSASTLSIQNVPGWNPGGLLGRRGLRRQSPVRAVCRAVPVPVEETRVED